MVSAVTAYTQSIRRDNAEYTQLSGTDKPPSTIALLANVELDMWVESLAILAAVSIVSVVTAVNDYQK